MKEKPSIPPRPTIQQSTVGSNSKISGNQSLQVAWTALNGDFPKRDTFVNEKDFATFCQYYNVLRTICRRAPQKRKEDEIKEFLTESKIPADVSKEILQLLRSDQIVQIDRLLLNDKPRLVHIVDIQWRISVTISTSFVSRSLIPYVQLSMTLSDGRIYELEMNLQKFHQLRHTIASILKEMQLIETMPKIQK